MPLKMLLNLEVSLKISDSNSILFKFPRLDKVCADQIWWMVDGVSLNGVDWEFPANCAGARRSFCFEKGTVESKVQLGEGDFRGAAVESV